MEHSVKIDRKLPPHELNARRARKRAVTQLPAIACLPAVPERPAGRHRKQGSTGNNNHVFNPADNPVTHNV